MQSKNSQNLGNKLKVQKIKKAKRIKDQKLSLPLNKVNIILKRKTNPLKNKKVQGPNMKMKLKTKNKRRNNIIRKRIKKISKEKEKIIKKRKKG